MKTLSLSLLLLLTITTVLFAQDLKTYRAIYDTQMGDIAVEHGTSIAELDESYKKALNGLNDRVTRAGNLIGIKAVMAEIERFSTVKTVTPPDAKDSSPDLKSMQLRYVQTLDSLQSVKAKKIIALTSKFDTALAKLQKSLAQQRKLDDATAVMGEREKIAKSEAVVSAQKMMSQKATDMVASGASSLPESQLRDRLMGKTKGISPKPANRGKFKPSTRGQVLSLTFENGVTDRLRKPALQSSNLKTTLAGKYGKGCEFTGNGSIGVGPITIPKSGAICLWANISPDADLAKEMRILDSNGICLQVLGDKVNASFNDGTGAGKGSAEITAGEWVHLAMTWGAGKRRFYVNGKLRTESDYSGKPMAPVRKLFVGSRWTGSQAFFMGQLDDIFIYERNLEAKEIAQVAAITPE